MGWFNTKEEKESKKLRKQASSLSRLNNRPVQTVTATHTSAPSTTVPSSSSLTKQAIGSFAAPQLSPNEDMATNTNTNETLRAVDNSAENLDGEETSRDYSREEESAEEGRSYMEATARQNHLNSLFNGHLMKWKFEAEEGSAFIRVPAFFGALGLLGTLIAAMVMQDNAFSSHAIVMGVAAVILSFFILILDGRFLSTNPLSTRAHLRNIITRNFNMFRFVWGRGLLYITAGVLNIAQMWLTTMISGGFMCFVGFVSIIVGVHASRKFAALRNSLADESFLLLVFSNYDGDGDGYLAPNEFALLLADLGMELDDRYTLKAFNVIDTDSDRRISFDEFNHWWASGYIERGRKRFDDEEEDDTYRRMD